MAPMLYILGYGLCNDRRGQFKNFLADQPRDLIEIETESMVDQSRRPGVAAKS